MNTNNNDIDSLLAYLKLSQPDLRWADCLAALIAERDALRKRVAELESQQPASDLRERLVCAALTGLMAQPAHGSRESWANIAVSFADATLDAMRKGESHGK